VPRLLLDSGFTSHPKVRALTDRQFRTLVRLLCYCAETDDATVDEGVMGEVSGLNVATVRRLAELRLLDRNDDGSYVVHHFYIYNGTTVDVRVAAFLETYPDATANEVAAGVPVRRQAVLDAVRRVRGIGPPGGSRGGSGNGSASGSESGSPSPSPSSTSRPEAAPAARARTRGGAGSARRGTGAGAGGLQKIGEALGLDAPIE